MEMGLSMKMEKMEMGLDHLFQLVFVLVFVHFLGDMGCFDVTKRNEEPIYSEYFAEMHNGLQSFLIALLIEYNNSLH